MSLNSILGNAASGLQVSQAQLRTVSDNVANVNTPGYIRKTVDQGSVVAGGQGFGVSIEQVRNVANQYLQATSLNAGADSARSGIVSSILDQAQSLFGNPGTGSSFFSGLDKMFSAFGSLAANPTSSGASQALAQVQGFFGQASDLSASLGQLSRQVDSQLSADVAKANQYLSQIESLNVDIARALSSTGDASGALNQQSQLIDQLSALMDVKVSSLPTGGVVVRAADGAALAGGGDGAAKLSYDGTAALGQLTFTNGNGVTQPLGARLASGELKGLLELRNTELPQVLGQLSELTAGVASQLNAIHNAYSAVPPPATLAGKNTGLDIATAIAGFTGKTTIAEVNRTTGALSHRIDVDFNAGTISVDGGAATGFTPSTFLSTLNTAMGGGSATFANGALTLTAGPGDGLAVQDDATSPASHVGRGFSAYFGLNDLVQSNTFTDFATGLTSSDASGFPSGQTLKLRLTDASGTPLQDVTVTTPAGSTMAALLGALNAAGPNGVGTFGGFSLDSSGRLSFSGVGGAAISVSVLSDSTSRTGTGASISQLFGIGDAARNARAGSFSVRSTLIASPTSISTSSLNLAAAPSQAVLSAGDTSGADALGQAGTATFGFDAAGGIAATSASLSDYAALIAASIARRASNADAAKSQSAALASEASARRSGYEGVNLDDELVRLTTYQQSYNASARMIQAAKDMYDALIQMVR